MQRGEKSYSRFIYSGGRLGVPSWLFLIRVIRVIRGCEPLRGTTAMIRRGHFLMLILLFAGTAAWAVAQSAEELEQNRRKLDSIRKSADELARLRENLQHFLALAPSQRDKIVQLDHDLRKLPASKQHRYTGVMERYAAWLEQLSRQDPRAYQAIKGAPSREARLVLIKERRDHEWIQMQARVYREQWDKLPAEARMDFVAKLRQEERQKHQQWVIAQRFWKELETKRELPCRLSDFSDKVKNYVKDYLIPNLTDAEKQQLTAAE